MNDVLTWPVGRATKSNKRRSRPPSGPPLSYLVGALIGGLFSGGTLAGAGLVLRSVTDPVPLYVAAVALGLLACGLQWRGSLGPLPQRHAQVPRRWLLWRSRRRTAFMFGFMIGSGALTYLQFAAIYVLVALTLTAPSVLSGALLGAAYGAARGLTLVITWLVDRFVGRRLQWDSLIAHRHVVHRSLAVLGLMTVLLASMFQMSNGGIA